MKEQIKQLVEALDCAIEAVKLSPSSIESTNLILLVIASTEIAGLVRLEDDKQGASFRPWTS